jgi:hypothetical protein
MRDAPYQPYYCEENAWHRAQRLAQAGATPMVLFISNARQQVILFNQRAAGPEGWVMWDYHVVVLCAGQIYDPDCTRGSPLDAPRWLDASFPPQAQVPAPYAPQFRRVPWPTLRAGFTTDRRHMRDAAGQWQQPPPSWSPPTAPGHGHNLHRWIDFGPAQIPPASAAEVLTLDALRAYLAMKTA